MARLLAVARAADGDGRCARRGGRYVLYAVAAYSGFRRGELLRLERQDCTPAGGRPRWHVDAMRTKNGMAADLPMSPECAEALAGQWSELPRIDSHLFAAAPNMKTWRRDLAAAGIVYRDERGRYADFHALRYTFAALVSRQFPIEVVSKLMRHSSIQLTVDVYLELGLDRRGEHEWVLPRLLEGVPTAGPTATEPAA